MAKVHTLKTRGGEFIGDTEYRAAKIALIKKVTVCFNSNGKDYRITPAVAKKIASREKVEKRIKDCEENIRRIAERAAESIPWNLDAMEEERKFLKKVWG